MKWRLIDTDLADPAFVTAADDAISIAKARGKVANTLHFYRREPPAISMGRFQSIKDINLEECKRRGIRIVRRITGGGNIYTDRGCLIYSLTFKQNNLRDPHDIFRDVCGAMVKAIERLDVDVIYKEPNDILVNGKKVSGSALIIKGDTVLIHGTVLVSTDVSLIEKLLLRRANVGVSNLEIESGREIDINEIKNLLRKEFENLFSANMVEGSLTEFELELIDQLIKERYGNERWNYER